MTTQGITQVVQPKHTGERFDAVAAALFPEYSRARLTQWIKEGRLTIDAQTQKPKSKVYAGQSLALIPDDEPQTNWGPQPIDVSVVYEDDDVIIVDKPVNLVVHPGAGNPEGTLVNGLVYHYPELASIPRAGIVHRIDKDTSGLLAVARSERAHKSLTEQLQDRSLSREYWCVALGTILTPGKVDAPIGRHPTHRVKMGVTSKGRDALTHYEIEARYPGATLLTVKLASGRTHQIRVHLAHIGHPLLGDPLYGGNRLLPASQPKALRDVQQSLGRQALHAQRLGMIHPDHGEYMEWFSDLPADLQALEDTLEGLC